MKSPLLRWLPLLALLLGPAALAQTADVTGTVTDADTGEPIPGVNILVQGTTVGTITDINGRYDLALPDGNRGLLFSYVGYRDFEVVLPPGVTAFDVQMEEDPLGLDEVVVTGLATSVKRSNLANSVGTISAEELVPAPAQTLERALNGKIAGISISQNTGAPGGGINVNLRGTSTITGDTQPLYVVDGVIVDNSAIEPGLDLITAATGAGSARPQGQPTNRIADINPNDIANIEVLKGASAAAIYGAKASNGVVLITTKRGQPGQTRINFSQQVGVSTILNKIGTRQFTPETAEEVLPGEGAELLAQNGQLDYEDLIYGREGLLSETSGSISGGDQDTRFFVSGLALNEDGIVDNTGYDKYSAKINVEQRFAERLRVNVTTSLTNATSNRSITGNENQGSTTLGFAQVFTLPFYDIRDNDGDGVFPTNPSTGSNPLQTIALLQNKEVSNRAIASGFAGLRLLQKRNQTLDFNVQGGADYYTLENNIISPPALQFEQAKDPSVRGQSVKGRTTSLSTNIGLSLVHFYSLPSSITFNTSAGYQYEARDLDNILAQTQGLIETQQNLDQGSSINVLQNRLLQRERGFFVQEEINVRDQFFVSGGFRADASSRVGDTDKFYFYPKVAASVRLSEFDFWQPMKGFANEFKLRAAFGRTGNLPLARAKFTSLLQENVAGTGGVNIPTLLGNPDIEPETTQEFEVGLDATLFDDRVTLETSYYTQDISDLILQNNLAASSGFTSQFINAGEMTTQGIEIALGGTPVNVGAFRWSTRFNFASNKSEITQLDVDPFEIGGFALFLGQFKIQEGVSPNTIVGLNEDGEETVFGNENPLFQLGWNNDFAFGRFRAGFLWDWKQGGDVINLGKFLSDAAGTTEDLDTPEGEARLASTSTGRYVEDGSYIKLREASLTYDVNPELVARWTSGQLASMSFGVSGRNLLMFTDYSGYDPEVSQFGNVAIGRAVDVLPFPSSRSFYFKVAVGL